MRENLFFSYKPKTDNSVLIYMDHIEPVIFRGGFVNKSGFNHARYPSNNNTIRHKKAAAPKSSRHTLY